MDNGYGITGDALYGAWVNRFEELNKKAKFRGENVDNELNALKKQVNDTMNEYVEKKAKRQKVGLISLLLPLFLLITGTFDLSGSNGESVLTFISILIPALSFYLANGCNKALDAAIDFDKKYFDGEIVFRRKNG